MDLDNELKKRGFEFNLVSMLKNFPTTVTLQKKDNGKYNAYCPVYSVGTLEGAETPEEAIGKLLVATIDFLKSVQNKSKTRRK